MGRRRRRPVKPRSKQWRAVRDGSGQWIVVNERGEQPLRSETPLDRLCNVHLAAAAPVLRESLEALARRLEHMESPYARDGDRLISAYGALAMSRPTMDLLAEVLGKRGHQLQLDLSAEVA